MNNLPKIIKFLDMKMGKKDNNPHKTPQLNAENVI